MPFLFALLFLAQDYSHRGFVETRTALYPQAASNDASHAVGEALLRHESFYQPFEGVEVAGAVDVRMDTHHQTERQWRIDWRDRTLQRPALSLRRFSGQIHRGPLTIEAGKQFVRWGRTDVVNPTDRFAPRDFMTVVDSEFLGIAAMRATYERGANTLDVVWSPWFTPSRIPLPNQRWIVTPPDAPVLPVERSVPRGSQAGVRWSHAGFVEFAAAYYSGFDHLPSFGVDASSAAIRQFYPRTHMAGGDVALPAKWFTVKAEAGYFSFPDDRIDEYVLYVVQLERQSGEWFFIGGYGGEIVTRRSGQSTNFNPERGKTRTVLARAGYTIDVNRSVALEAAVRQNLDGAWIRGEYSQAIGQHWRWTAGLSLIRGEPSDFLGQYRRNSHASIAVRYSF